MFSPACNISYNMQRHHTIYGTYTFYIILSLGCGFWWPVASISTQKNLKTQSLSRDPKPLVHGLKLKFAFQLMDVVFIVVGWLATCLHIETWGIHLWKRAIVLQGTCFVHHRIVSLTFQLLSCSSKMKQKTPKLWTVGLDLDDRCRKWWPVLLLCRRCPSWWCDSDGRTPASVDR